MLLSTHAARQPNEFTVLRPRPGARRERRLELHLVRPKALAGSDCGMPFHVYSMPPAIEERFIGSMCSGTATEYEQVLPPREAGRGRHTVSEAPYR